MSHEFELPRRYLTAFDPRDLPHHFADVLIIGGGLAGLRAVLGVPERLSGAGGDEGRGARRATARMLRGGSRGCSIRRIGLTIISRIRWRRVRGCVIREGGGDGGEGGSSEDRGTGEVGDAVRSGGWAGGSGDGGGAFAQEDRACAWGCDGKGGDAGGDCPDSGEPQREDLAE